MALNFGGIGGGGVANVAFSLAQAPSQYKQNLAAGQSTFEAAGKTANSSFWWSSLSLYGALTLPELAKAPGMLVNSINSRNFQTRQASQPFSQSIRHSQQASNMQSYSMSRISEMEGFGTEASQFFGRFGR